MQSRQFANSSSSKNKESKTDSGEQVRTQSGVEKQTPRRVRASKKSASAFRTISEVATELDVQQHVLRFWETKFSQIKPLKRGGGRRYYRPEDMDLLKRIHHLLYTEGYTIKGVQKLLREQGKKAFVEQAKELPQTANDQAALSNASTTPQSKTTEQVKIEPVIQEKEVVKTVVKTVLSEKQKADLRNTLEELKELRKIVKGD